MQRQRWSIRRARVLVGTKFLLLAGLVGFVVVAWLVELVARLDGPVHFGPIAAGVMCAIPAVLWLGFFYLMDRHEPEPKQLVVGVSVLGALIAAPLADFLQFQAVPPVALAHHGFEASSVDRVVYAILIVGLCQEMCKYAVVRYTVYMSREFDEPMDGIVYMMACGTGFAVWMNYQRLSAQGHSIFLSTGAAQCVVTTLAHASFAGLLGYVMGRAKFSRRSAPIRGALLMLGLLGAAVLNGQLTLVDYWLELRGQSPWREVTYVAVYSSLVFGMIWLVSRRLLASSPFRRSPVTDKPDKPDDKPDEAVPTPVKPEPSKRDAALAFLSKFDEAPTSDPPKLEATGEPPKFDTSSTATSSDPPKLESAASDPPKLETSTTEPPKLETSIDPPKLVASDPPKLEVASDPPKLDTSSTEPPKLEAAAGDPPKRETAASDPPKLEVANDPPKLDTASTEPPKLEAAAGDPPKLEVASDPPKLVASDPPKLETSSAEPPTSDTTSDDAPKPDDKPPVYDDPDDVSMPAPDPQHVPAPPPMQMQSSMFDPAAAALEAARIAGEIVGDIESASGAAIVAAAAAGAAIEAARARAAMGFSNEPNVSPRDSVPAMDAAAIAAAAASSAPTESPTVTVRMQRERILRALANDVAATATSQAQAQAAQAKGEAPPAIPPTQNRPRADREGEQTTDEAADEDGLDPVQIAAAAIQRLRHRARTDFAELRVHYHRHDLFVLLFAFVIIVVAGRMHRDLVTPPTQVFEQRGLQLELQQGWLGPEPLPDAPPRIVRPADGLPPKPTGAFHAAFTWPHDPNARVEILVDKKPAWTNTVTWLDLDRRTRWGELYSLDDSSIRSVEDQDWLRTAYRYAHAIEKGDVPRVDRAVEYATIDREQLYIITLFGSPAQIARMESVIAPSLKVPTRSGLPLVTQTRSLVQRTFPGPVQAAFDSTVMIVVADLGPDKRLRASGGGSGVVVGSDGSILTAYHVLHKEKGQLHDVFVIGRFGSRDRAPQLVCAGRPSRSKLRFEDDLALIKCDTDLDGRTWAPKSAGVWPTLLEGRDEDVRMGQHLWVLGYPDAGGGGLTLYDGEVEGWTGVDGSAGKTFIKTNASITTGNSGGPVIDDQGRLVGIASGFRPKAVAQGNIIEIKQTGLVRPITTASCLLAIAQLGWTPREDSTTCDLEPTSVEASAEGIRLQTRVVDGANDAPVRDALVMVLRRGVDASSVDVNRLSDQVLSWGRTNSQGEVQLKQPVPVPGTYTVMAVATNYEALIEQNALVLDESNANVARAVSQSLPYDPWGKIELRSR